MAQQSNDEIVLQQIAQLRELIKKLVVDSEPSSEGEKYQHFKFNNLIEFLQLYTDICEHCSPALKEEFPLMEFKSMTLDEKVTEEMFKNFNLSKEDTFLSLLYNKLWSDEDKFTWTGKFDTRVGYGRKTYKNNFKNAVKY